MVANQPTDDMIAAYKVWKENIDAYVRALAGWGVTPPESLDHVYIEPAFYRGWQLGVQSVTKS